MKKLILFIVMVSFYHFADAQGLYQLPIKNIDGNPINLNSFSGKKVLFFILPLSASDSNYNQLQLFKNRYADTVQIIGIPSFEDGYQGSAAQTIKGLYANWGILLTEGMYTKKASASQSLLLKWLTDKTKNAHYDMDSKGVGTKFFVSGGGMLFAVLPPQASLSMPLVNKIVHSTGSL